MKLIITWAGSLAVFLALDFIWLGVIANHFYQTRLSSVVDVHVNWVSAVAFYVLHVIGVMVFVITPACGGGGGVVQVLWRGAFYGLFTYAAYDLTNLATIRDWPLSLAFVDMSWGMVLNAIVALSGFAILRRFG